MRVLSKERDEECTLSVLQLQLMLLLLLEEGHLFHSSSWKLPKEHEMEYGR